MRWGEWFLPAIVADGVMTSDGELAPIDIVAHRLVDWAKGDEKLLSIFTEHRIEYIPAYLSADFREVPRLQFYATSITVAEAPTRIDLNEVRLYVGIRFDPHVVEPVPPWEASIMSVDSYVVRRMHSIGDLQVEILGIQTPLCRFSEAGPVVPVAERTVDGDLVALTLERELVFSVAVDHDTQRIANINQLIPS